MQRQEMPTRGGLTNYRAQGQRLAEFSVFQRPWQRSVEIQDQETRARTLAGQEAARGQEGEGAAPSRDVGLVAIGVQRFLRPKIRVKRGNPGPGTATRLGSA